MAIIPNCTDLAVVRATLSYLKNLPKYDYEKPYVYNGPLAPHQEAYRTNIELDLIDNIPAIDLRNLKAHWPNIEDDGFQLFYRPSLAGLPRQDSLQGYLEETAELTKTLLGAELTICYDYRFRKNAMIADPPSGVSIGTQMSPVPPNNIAHIDQSLAGGQRRAQAQLTTEEARQYLDGNWRVRIVNAWRPLGHIVDDAPLAFCEFSTVDEEDIVTVDRLAAAFVGEALYLKYNPNHRWYWYSQQQPDEVVLFVNYDSAPKPNGPRFCPHASFQIPNAPNDFPRESIEVRMIVVSKIICS